ncbi:MAG: ribonuclease III [Planctomycetota bacterium]
MTEKKPAPHELAALPTDAAELDQHLAATELKLGYPFRDRKHLRQALTHSSAKDAVNQSNERLEYLGDAVLGFVVSEYIFNHLGDANEGELTRIKSVVVSKASLLKLAKKLQLQDHLLLGKGVRKRRSVPTSLLADAVESVIGSIFIDGGLEAAKPFILEHFTPFIRTVLRNRHAKNYKSMLQHFTQQKMSLTPEYALLATEGPDHSKMFEVATIVNGRQFPAAKGRNKKIAEQRAARMALKLLRDEHGTDP